MQHLIFFRKDAYLNKKVHWTIKYSKEIFIRNIHKKYSKELVNPSAKYSNYMFSVAIPNV
ncbi:MAG: hypothetical protein IT267_07605 [Saprospiraceae bacterium]|nr:hypothetical protein [Saprospiraceae bacterium]